jgi:methylamine--corrinoid protein Co-methyltransferase
MIGTSPTEYGQFGGLTYGGLRQSDVGVVLAISELKTSYSLLHKVVHVTGAGMHIFAGHWSMLGGYAGGPEGCAVTEIASALLRIPIHRATLTSLNIFDMRSLGNSSREAIWSSSIGRQALSRNTDLLFWGSANPVSGPCTEMILLESLAGAISTVVSGSSFIVGVRSAGGKYPNHSTGLEGKFVGEACRALSGIKRPDANDLIKKILPRYEDKLINPPKGKAFPDCYDQINLKPSEEWREIYQKIVKDVIDLGISI